MSTSISFLRTKYPKPILMLYMQRHPYVPGRGIDRKTILSQLRQEIVKKSTYTRKINTDEAFPQYQTALTFEAMADRQDNDED
ncbi:hypothetical protein MA16_Dca020911 [Dendrobium catenatum]|uniref:Uncharacterized protein n=1 Tax=Dendrobium catenatum TaxID=906689 RepID=A0A2I0VN40_9ASPA|nr:hypothetical protein MA16_Dca020911 [Dendrobium catenatum]